METFILNIKNKTIAKELENYLYNFGTSIKLTKLSSPIAGKKAPFSNGNFFDMAGLWEDSDITIKKIREESWRKI